MADKQKYIGKSWMKDNPLKPFKLIIGNKVVKTKHIDDENITNDKLADNAVSKEKIANKQVSWQKLDDDLQNIIASREEHGVALSKEFGESELIGITQKKLTEEHEERIVAEGDLQDQIDAIVMSQAIVNLAATPSPVFVGEEAIINLTATTDTVATNIKIKKGGTEIATGSGSSLSGTDTITPDVAGNTTYTAEFTIAGLLKSTTKNVFAVYPIRTGSGSSYVDGTPLTTPKASPVGTYNVVVAQDGDYVFFNIPSSMTINNATMSGFNFPLDTPENVEIEGVTYKSYKSSNTYDAGTLTIVIS